MNIQEALDLKVKGILNLDNCICVDNFTEKQVQLLKSYLIQQKQEVIVLNCNKLFTETTASMESSAIKYLYILQKYLDIILRSNKLYLIQDIHKFYDNNIINSLQKTNPAFVCWFLAFNYNCNPIMFLNTKPTSTNKGLINVIAKEDIVEAFNKGLEKLENIIQN